MPIYEYECDKCGHAFEREQRMSEDPPVKTCPKCKGRKVRRLIFPNSFVLKGGGWYSDLYSSSKPAADSGAKGDGDSASAAAARRGIEAGIEVRSRQPGPSRTRARNPEARARAKSKGKVCESRVATAMLRPRRSGPPAMTAAISTVVVDGQGARPDAARRDRRRDRRTRRRGTPPAVSGRRAGRRQPCEPLVHQGQAPGVRARGHDVAGAPPATR